MNPPVMLKHAPDWAAAAQLLVDGCAHAPDAAYRADLLERLSMALGDQLYPAFLNVLCRVGELGTPGAQAAVADALVDALRSGRLPAGRRAAWGARQAPRGTHSPVAQALGPIEYLCAWYADPGADQAPSAATFDRALQSLLRLVGHSPRARSLYAGRLTALADEPLSGTLSRSTRHVLQQLAQAWAVPQASPQQVADVCMRAIGRSGFGALGAPESRA